MDVQIAYIAVPLSPEESWDIFTVKKSAFGDRNMFLTNNPRGGAQWPVNTLKAVPSSSELIRTLDRIAIPASVPMGAALYRCGDPASAVFIVHQGLLVLERTVDNYVVQLESIGHGQITGLPAALNGTYNVTARVIKDSELAYIPVSWVIDLLRDDSRLCLSAAKLIAEEAARMRPALAQLLPTPVRESDASVPHSHLVRVKRQSQSSAILWLSPWKAETF